VAGGIGEGAGCVGVYRASGLGLPGAPSILDVHAQAGTRGAHQAARKTGRCRGARGSRHCEQRWRGLGVGRALP